MRRCGRSWRTSNLGRCCHRWWCCRRWRGSRRVKDCAARTLLAEGTVLKGYRKTIALAEAYSPAQVREVLAHIEAGALLPPLVVLQALARNPQLKLAVVKDYAARTLAAEGAAVEGDRKAIARFEEETAAMRAEAAELKTKARRRSCLKAEAPLQLEELGVIMRRLEARAHAAADTAVLTLQDGWLFF